jgi:hypothetical protein
MSNGDNEKSWIVDLGQTDIRWASKAGSGADRCGSGLVAPERAAAQWTEEQPCFVTLSLLWQQLS